MTAEKKEKVIELLQLALEKKRKEKEKYDWDKNARPSQKPPKKNWHKWLIMAGRGFGKTRTGAETIKKLIQKGYRRICLLGCTDEDVYRVMIQGESGLMNIYPENERPTYSSSKGELTWPNGAKATICSAHSYEQLRGLQFDAAWIDELAKFPSAKEVYDQLSFCLRLNSSDNQEPKMIITTTPKPIPLIKDLSNDSSVILTTGSTFENKDNLSKTYITSIEKNYDQSRFGMQEIHGKIIEDTDNAFCQKQDIIYNNINPSKCEKIIVAIDPALSNTRDETGIVVCGLTKLTTDSEEYKYVVLEDASGLYKPSQWGEISCNLYNKYNADHIVAETNQGGDMVETILKQFKEDISFKKVHATKGKMVRSQPISMLYERKEVYHADHFGALEKQMLTPYHTHSPDRLDALVWGITSLMKDNIEPNTNESWCELI